MTVELYDTPDPVWVKTVGDENDPFKLTVELNKSICDLATTVPMVVKRLIKPEGTESGIPSETPEFKIADFETSLPIPLMFVAELIVVVPPNGLKDICVSRSIMLLSRVQPVLPKKYPCST